MLSPTRKSLSRRAATRQFTINDENVSPHDPSPDASMSLQPSEPPSSPLISNSLLYNLPDPTVGLPGLSANPEHDIVLSPFKRSMIASLNKPLSREQTVMLDMHKTATAHSSHQLPISAPQSPSKANVGSTRRFDANLDAPGGLPTPPSSSEFLNTTPGPSNKPLTSLPREPVSPSPSRTRAYVLSPARAAPTKASAPASTPRASRRGSASRSVRADDQEDSDEDDTPRSAIDLASQQTRSLPEIDEDSEDEEGEQEEEIQLISFKRGGPDATFVREIKENGWDQPLPQSPIKFTYLKPDPPRPARQSSVSVRARSHSRSKTPQIRSSPAPSQRSRASSRARSLRAGSVAAAEQVDDVSDESIKSSGTALTLASKISGARSNRSLSSRRSVARSSVAPPVLVADLTRDHPSLPDSPGDDPLLLTGPDTYIVYHDQTPSAKNRSTSRVSRTTSAGIDASLSMHSHSTPLPAAAATISSQRRDSSSSSASRNSLYTRMSGKKAADVSGFAADDEENDDSQSTEHMEAMHYDDDAGDAFVPFDDGGYASEDEPAAFEHGSSSPTTEPVESAQPMEDASEERHDEDMSSSLSDLSRSSADDYLAHERDEISGPVDSSTFDASAGVDELDDSAVVDQSLRLGLASQSLVAGMDVDDHDKSGNGDANDQEAMAFENDQTMDSSAAEETAEITGELSELLDDQSSHEELDSSAQESSTDLSDLEESVDVSVVDRSTEDVVDHSIGDQSVDRSIDQSVNESSAILSNNEDSQDVSTSVDGEDVAAADLSAADISMADTSMATDDDGEGVNQSDQEADVSYGSAGARPEDVLVDVDSERSRDSEDAAEDSQAPDETHTSADAELLEADVSVESSAPSDVSSDLSEATGDESLLGDSKVPENHSDTQEGLASSLLIDPTIGSIDRDVSLNASERAAISTAGNDGDLLPHPVVLIETLPADSSANMAWKVHQAGLDSGHDDDEDFTFEIEISRRGEQGSDVSMAVADRSVAEDVVDVSVQHTDDGLAVSRSDSMSSGLSSAPPTVASDRSENEQEDEELRRKYQDSREIALKRGANLSRRLSLSTDSEAESDADQEFAEEQDDEEDLQDADASSQRPDASHARSARSLTEDRAEEQDDEEEEDEDNDNESALGDDAASGTEEYTDEEEDEIDEEEDEEDLEETSEGEEVDDSQLEQDEQSGSLMDPIVVISSSASPSGASTSALQSEDDEEEEEGYIVQVVRDPRDRSLRTSEHSVIDEPQIHTLNLRQPAPRPSSLVDDTHRSQTLADASHSRSRVMKLNQPTSTPIVEISSLDPRAAARATAILKLFHKYVDEGWISGAEMGDATEGRMRRVVDAIQRADRHGRRLEDASELQQSTTVEDAAADLTTLLMDAELSLAREGTVDSESFLGSRATSVASQRPVTASPATPFLPGGFRATPASSRAIVASIAAPAQRTGSPSVLAASRSTAAGTRVDDSTSTVNQSRRQKTSTSFTFPGLSTPDRSRRRRSPAKEARLSAALLPPTASTFSPRIWDTADWVRLDKYFTSGVKKISSHLFAQSTLSSGSSRTAKAHTYVDALLGIDANQVAKLFLDEMQIRDEKRTSEWEEAKVEARILALQRKYLRKVEQKYAQVVGERVGGQELEGSEDDSMATEDLDWSLNANTTAATQEAARGPRAARVSFGTPYRMGAHSTPAVGLLKRATIRAAKERIGEQREQESLYPPLPVSPPSTSTASTGGDWEGGVMTKASRLISRLSGGFGGLLASPRVTLQGEGRGDKGKRKATEAEMEVLPIVRRRRMDDSEAEDESTSTDTSESDSLVESLLSPGGMRSTINTSVVTNATSIRSSTSSRPLSKPNTALGPSQTSLNTTLATTTRPRSNLGARTFASTAPTSTTRHNPTASLGTRPMIGAAGPSAAPRAGARSGLTSSLQLSGGSSGVSHTPLSLLSPATHRVAAAKVERLRQSRAERNWTSPTRQRTLASRSTRIQGGDK